MTWVVLANTQFATVRFLSLSFFLSFFVPSSRAQVASVDRFWQPIRLCAWGCAFFFGGGVRWYCCPPRSQIPPNRKFGGANKRFQAKPVKAKKPAYYQSYCVDYNHILHSDKDQQTHFVGGPNTHLKSKTADGRHLGKFEKSLYLGDG